MAVRCGRRSGVGKGGVHLSSLRMLVLDVEEREEVSAASTLVVYVVMFAGPSKFCEVHGRQFKLYN
jgi:hypothetical protein